MNIGFSGSEKAELGRAVAALESLSSQIAIDGLTFLVDASSGRYEPKIWWQGADTMVFEPDEDVRAYALNEGDEYVETVHAPSLGATFEQIAKIVIQLGAYDATTKYDLWHSVTQHCARVVHRLDMSAEKLCQEAVWEALRVLRRWKETGTGQDPVFEAPDPADELDEDSGAHWFLYGDFLSPKSLERIPTAPYVSRAALPGWTLKESPTGFQIERSDNLALRGLVVLLNAGEEERLQAVAEESEPRLTHRTAVAEYPDGSAGHVSFFAPFEQAPRQSIQVPKEGPDLTLPFFAYGLFMPSQLGFERLRPLVRRKPRTAYVKGQLWERDGIPLLDVCVEHGSVSGYLIEFGTRQAMAAYSEIEAVEPSSQYRWAVCEVEDERGNSQRANVLRGYKPARGGHPLEEHQWDGRRDPFFSTAFELVTREVEQARRADRGPENSEAILKIQMAYALLWSAAERFCALRYSLLSSKDQSIMRRVSMLADEPAFQQVIQNEPDHTWIQLRRIYRSDDPAADPSKPLREGRASPGATIRHLYQIRSNVVHRGKESIGDLDLLITATDLLSRALRAVLADAFQRCELPP